jgi:hypothetical protein
LGQRAGLTRVGRNEDKGSRRWLNSRDDPERARAELTAGVNGVDVVSGPLRMRVGGLPLLRRGPDGTRRQAVRAIIDWPREPATVTVALHCDGALDEQITVDLKPGPNRLLLFARDTRQRRAAAVVLSDHGQELLRASFALEPEREWTIYLIHHSHLDIGYTDAQDTVLRHHRSYLDQVLDLADASAGWPDDAQFRWSIEANWPLQEWIQLRPAARVNALFDLARAGRVEVTALPFNLHTEACSADELAHMLRFADDLRRRHGIDVSTAMQTDVPGATVGLAQLLVDAGVDFLSVSHNYAGRSVPHHVGGQSLTRPFYWQAPAGGRLLTWFGDTPHGMAYMEGTMLGLSSSYEESLDLLPEYLAALASRPYPYEGALSEWWRVPAGELLTKQPYPYDILHLRVMGAYCDNAGPSLTPADIVRQWNEQWEYPRLRMATNADFARAARERLGDRLDTYEGDWTDWWADGLGSAARFVGLNRRTQAAVRTVQSLHTLSDTLGMPATGDHAAGINGVYDDMALFDEHTWGAAEPWEDTLEGWWSGPLQWQAKSGFALSAAERSADLAESGLERLTARLTTAGGTEPVVVVVNPTMHARTDIVRTFVPASRFSPGAGIQLVDLATGERVPCQPGEPDYDRDRRRSRGLDLTFRAADVPGFGYRAYRLADEPVPAGAAPADDGQHPVLRNEAFELTYDLAEGCIAALVDRRTGTDLVAANPIFGFGQYVYDRFTTAPRFNHLSSKIESRRLELLGERAVARHAALISRSSTALGDSLTVRLAAPGTSWLDLTVTLPAGLDRVDLEYRLAKPDEEEKESGYIAFPFRAAHSGLRAEITGGVYHPAAPLVPGSAEHMRAIRHWVRLGGDHRSISWATLEAPLVQFGNIHLPYAPFPATLEGDGPDCTTIYSWLFNNIWDTNFPSSQAGEISFRFAISASDASAGDAPARRLATAVTTPLLASVAAGLAPGTPPSGSFCAAETAAEVLAVRRSRCDGDLSILVESASAQSEPITLRFPHLDVREAWVGDHLDRVIGPAQVEAGVVRAMVRPGALSTVLLRTETDGSR